MQQDEAYAGAAVVASAPPDVADPFYYGQRMVEVYDEHGKRHWDYVPLTLDDYLDPQEGDHFMQDSHHYADVDKARSIFEYHYRHDPTVAVFSDLKMLWGIKGLAEPCPDVAVVPNIRDPKRRRKSFHVIEEGTRPCLVVEIVSARYRGKDTEDKVAIYAQAGVQEYFILDSQWTESAEDAATPDYTVRGYRLEDGAYVALLPDERGWVYSAVTGVWIGPTASRDDFIIVDAATEERILPVSERAAAAEQRAVEAEREKQALQAELERLRAQLAQLSQS